MRSHNVQCQSFANGSQTYAPGDGPDQPLGFHASDQPQRVALRDFQSPRQRLPSRILRTAFPGKDMFQCVLEQFSPTTTPLSPRESRQPRSRPENASYN